MNGVHDMGGMQGYGPIDIEQNEPVFHDDWEKRMFALFLAVFAGGHYNIDQFRHSIERMDPADYLRTTYYEHWMSSMQRMLVEKGLVTEAEINARMADLAKGAS